VSSAILYVAIVAIWACVLIPRWLRRDPARGSSHVAVTATPGDAIADDVTSGQDIPAGSLPPRSTAPPVTAYASSGLASASPGDGLRTDAAPVSPPVQPEADEHPGEATADQAEQEDAPPPPLTPEEVRQRMLSARRRLLGILIALEAAAIALAVLGLAALWVVIPPSVMLVGYLLLLREVAHADAERARHEREAAWARARAREQARAARRAAPVATAAAATAATSAAPAAPAADFDDAGPGRDFAPGLAGKYTASNAEVFRMSGQADEDKYDEDTQSRLRAVGD
jgi:hypothetical protein